MGSRSKKMVALALKNQSLNTGNYNAVILTYTQMFFTIILLSNCHEIKYTFNMML